MQPASPSAALARLVAFWDRLRGSAQLKGALLLAVVASLVALAALMPSPDHSFVAGLERYAFDQEMRLLRAYHPRPIADDIVLVGTDEVTDRVFDEPLALWHRRLASVMHALAKAKPRAVGIDFVLPERSFEKIAPGIDLAMMRGLLDLKRSTHLVFVQTVDRQNKLVPVQENYLRILTADNLGVDQHYQDPDTVSRRFGPLMTEDGKERIPSLVDQILRGLGKASAAGFIDYSLGVPLRYVPIHEIPQWDEARLKRTFEGRVVLIGSLFHHIDRWPLPAKLLEVDPGRPSNAAEDSAKAYIQPGVLIHLQALRSLLGPGLLRPLPEWARWLLCAAAALVVFVRARPEAKVVIAALAPLVVLAAGLVSIVTLQVLIPVAALLTSFWLALGARGIFDAIEAVVERLRLQASFNGQVSPP
jgi:CHASE2 domain-containing sensor protein